LIEHVADPLSLTARDAVNAIRRGRLTAEAYVSACLRRIGELEPQIGAWVCLDGAATLARAHSAPPGPLHGLPIGVKDIFDTTDYPTAYGSQAYEAYQPASDAACVALAKQAGAIVVGKTATTEFAAMAPAITRNPHNTAHTPGGSSAGSAAAVAAGMVPLAFGTQTAGSIIRPASYCGVVGFKPSFGAIPRAGVKTLSDSLDTVGLIGRNVRDVAWFGAVISGRSSWAVDGAIPPRIGLCRTMLWERASSDGRATVLNAFAEAGTQGATLAETGGPADYFDLISAHITVMGWETPRALAYEIAFRAGELKQRTLSFIRPDPPVAADAYDAALAKAHQVRMTLDEAWGDNDVLLTLSALDTAPASLETTGDPICSRVWTLLGVPCITIPAATSAAGLPIGVQLVGKPGADADLLRAAAFVEDTLARH
jgi:amidase